MRNNELILICEPTIEMLDLQIKHYEQYNYFPNWLSFSKENVGYLVLLQLNNMNTKGGELLGR